jgi:hypothetical protein
MSNAEATPPTQELPIEAAPDGRAQSAEPRRFRALAAAVRAHQVVTAHSSIATRPTDQALYRRLGEIESPPPAPGEEPG